jgi:hypothetical protein
VGPPTLTAVTTEDVADNVLLFVVKLEVGRGKMPVAEVVVVLDVENADEVVDVVEVAATAPLTVEPGVVEVVFPGLVEDAEAVGEFE